VYNSWLKRVRLQRMMLWGSLLGCALGMTPLLLVEGLNRKLGISDRLFALVDSALLSSVGQVGGGVWYVRYVCAPDGGLFAYCTMVLVPDQSLLCI
jgi:hypothetical protein